MHLEQELLATPLLGSGEKGLTLIKSLPSFCKRQVVWVWTAGYGKGLHPPQTGGQVPWCPQSLPESGSQDFCCPHEPGCGPGPAAPGGSDCFGCCWHTLPLPVRHLLSLHSFWEIFTIYSNSGYLLQIGKCLVWGCGGSWEGRRGVRSMFFGLSEVRLGILSPCLWNLPGSPARLLGVL